MHTCDSEHECRFSCSERDEACVSILKSAAVRREWHLKFKQSVWMFEAAVLGFELPTAKAVDTNHIWAFNLSYLKTMLTRHYTDTQPFRHLSYQATNVNGKRNLEMVFIPCSWGVFDLWDAVIASACHA